MGWYDSSESQGDKENLQLPANSFPWALLSSHEEKTVSSTEELRLIPLRVRCVGAAAAWGQGSRAEGSLGHFRYSLCGAVNGLLKCEGKKRKPYFTLSREEHLFIPGWELRVALTVQVYRDSWNLKTMQKKGGSPTNTLGLTVSRRQK